MFFYLKTGLLKVLAKIFLREVLFQFRSNPVFVSQIGVSKRKCGWV